MRVFIPDRPLALPMRTGDVLTNRLLREGEPYLVNQGTAASLEQLIRSGNVSGRLNDVEPRPVTGNPTRTLVFWSGEVGDALCAAPLGWTDGDVMDYVTLNHDRVLFPEASVVFQYPITLRLAEWYTAWVEFDARADQSCCPSVAFSKLLGSRRSALWNMPLLDVVAKYARRTDALLGGPAARSSGRRRVGIRINADSHYRSWNPAMACVTMVGLVEAGYDCYVIGDNQHRLQLKRDGEVVRMWGEGTCGMYDTCGLFASVEEYVSLVSMMNVVVTPDCGTLHIANALGVPVVGLFGPTSGESTSALSLSSGKDCSPCFCAGDHAPCEGRTCEAMLQIQPEQIVEAVKQVAGGMAN